MVNCQIHSAFFCTEMPGLQLQEMSVSAPLSADSSICPKKLPWGCPPGFSENSKNIVELEEPSDCDLRENSNTREHPVQHIASKKHSNKTIPWILPKVPAFFHGRAPPYPLFKKTVDDRACLCFFSKIYAFSNHYSSDFRIEGELFCSSEQYYTWRKSKHFGFDMIADEIMENSMAKVIKQLGHADNLRERRRLGKEPNSREFDHAEWKEAKEKIMLTALRAKFTQNPFLERMLVETQDALLVEASPTDKYWGIGCSLNSEEITNPSQWKGLNRMGILLQILRQELRWARQKTEEKGGEMTEPKGQKKQFALKTNKFYF